MLRALPMQNPRGAQAFVRNGLVESGSPDSFADAASRCAVFVSIPCDAAYREATMIRTPSTPIAGQAVGILADGAVKILLAIAYVVGAESLSHRLGVATWLLIACAAALLITGGSELAYLRNRPMNTYLRLMIGYDSGWSIVTVVALLLAWQGNRAAGELWIGYQTIAPLAFTVLLIAADGRDSAPE